MHYYVNLFKVNCKNLNELNTCVEDIKSKIKDKGVSSKIKVFLHKKAMYVLPMDSNQTTIDILSKSYEDVSVWDEKYAPEGMSQKKWDNRKALLRTLMPTGNANDSGLTIEI